MYDKELFERLKEIKIENYIWIIYVIIIIASWYANSLEKKFFINNDELSKKKYQDLTIKIFLVLVIIYIYFFYESYKGLKELKDNDPVEKKRLVLLSFIGSTLILLSGIIFLYVSIKDENLDVELAFN